MINDIITNPFRQKHQIIRKSNDPASIAFTQPTATVRNDDFPVGTAGFCRQPGCPGRKIDSGRPLNKGFYALFQDMLDRRFVKIGIFRTANIQYAATEPEPESDGFSATDVDTESQRFDGLSCL